MSTVVSERPAGIDGDTSPPTRVGSWISDFSGPYRLMLRPARLGELIRNASVSAILSTLLISIPLVVAMVITLIFLEGMFSHPSRTFDQMWQILREGPGPSVLEGVIFIAPVITIAIVAVIGLLSLQDVFRDGPVRHALVRCFLMSVSALPLFMLIVMPAASLLITFDQRSNVGPGIDFVLFTSTIAIGFWLVVAWMTRALSVLGNTPEPASLEYKLCENCGYNITHAAIDSICPECGVPVRPSILPELSRRGVHWETGGPNKLINSMLSAFFSPEEFYGRLQLRSGVPRAGQFAAAQLFLMGIAAACWVFTLACLDREKNWLRMGALIGWGAGACLVPIIAWLVTRGVAAIVALVWFSRGLLRDGRWLAKVACYELVYVWLFCAFSGILITTYVLGGNWVSSLLRNVLKVRSFYSLPAEPILVLGGNVLIICLWFLRYRKILRAIQYSNN